MISDDAPRASLPALVHTVLLAASAALNVAGVRHLRAHEHHPLTPLLPPLPVLLTFAPAAALNDGMWDVAPVQCGFWLTCATCCGW